MCCKSVSKDVSGKWACGGPIISREIDRGRCVIGWMQVIRWAGGYLSWTTIRGCAWESIFVVLVFWVRDG